ncbi:MAG: hypothetical protein methR_P0200 [Methyloprofundus sp.]|nr:MAG: hypothetical protein methR_P0200 [Methyloprofundus sp.]
MSMFSTYLRPGFLLVLLIACHVTQAETRIAILDFELNDITSLPHTPQELQRTASIQPLLEQAMREIGEYQIIKITPKQQQAENAGFGYLFHFHDIVAKLGKGEGADWIIVGQHSKPSFLFSYLMAHVINVKTGKLVVRFDIELKGNHQKVTRRAVSKLAREINRVIKKVR